MTVVSLNDLLLSAITTIDSPAPSIRVPETLTGMLCVETLRVSTNAQLWQRAIELLQQSTPTVTTAGESILGSMKGSTGTVYEQELTLGTFKTRATHFLQFACTCPAPLAARPCKHGLAMALHALGYRPDGSVPSPPAADVPPADELSEVAVRQLLAEMAKTHVDVTRDIYAATAAAGGTNSARYWTSAAWYAVEHVLCDYDYDRKAKEVGEAVAGSLQVVRDVAFTAEAGNSIDGLIAVIDAAVAAAVDQRCGDGYGDLDMTVDSCLDQIVTITGSGHGLTEDQRARLAGAVVQLAAAPDLVEYWTSTSHERLADLVGASLTDVLAGLIRVAEEDLAVLLAASAPAADAARHTRKLQIDKAGAALAAVRHAARVFEERTLGE